MQPEKYKILNMFICKATKANVHVSNLNLWNVNKLIIKYKAVWFWLRNVGGVKFHSCHRTSMAITPDTLGKNEKYISNKWFHK